MSRSLPLRRLVAATLLFVWAIPGGSLGGAAAAESRSLRRALESIRAAELKTHVDALADDTMEGREVGSRGGQAAAGYLVHHLRRLGIKGGAADGSYYQPLPTGGKNVLAFIPGSDPQLAQQVIVVGAHYDHVGYGNSRTSYGPFGYIHNGADDNASGTAALLEFAEAVTLLPTPPKRSLLLAWWDGEEQGLHGSKHWFAQPTLARDRVVFGFNLDMIGRLRNDELQVIGSRTAFGLRQLVSRQNQETRLALDFRWENKSNSDHWTFFDAQVPVLMFHTGEHPDYHRPSDDIEKINNPGIERISRLLLNVVYELADQPQITAFRHASRQETTESDQRRFEQPLSVTPGPGRFGVSWNAPPAGGLVLSEVIPNSPAALAGLRVGDRLLLVGQQYVDRDDTLLAAVYRAHGPTPVVFQRDPQAEPELATVPLSGPTPRLGLNYREDDADPQSVMIVHIQRHSPAARAGLQPLDRIYRVASRPFRSPEEFLRLCREGTEELEMEIERNGQLRTARLTHLAEPQ